MEMQAVLIASSKSRKASTSTVPGVVEVVSPGGSSKVALSLADQLDQLKTVPAEAAAEAAAEAEDADLVYADSGNVALALAHAVGADAADPAILPRT